MRYLSRYRRPHYYSNPWAYNPDSWESDVRKLLQKITGIGWRVGQPPPPRWHAPYLSNHPEWSPLWLVATSLQTTPDELLAKIRPGKRKLRDVDELNVFYDFIKEHLVKQGHIRGKDVAALAGNLGLASLSGTHTDAAKERSYLLKQLVRDGYANQIMGRFKGSSHYLPTQKLIEEQSSKPTITTPLLSSPAVLPPPVEIPIAEIMPIPFYMSEEPLVEPSAEQVEILEPKEWVTEVVAPHPPKKSKKTKPQPTRKILIIGGQGNSCPDGTPSLRAIKKAECAWLDKNFRWRVLVSYRNEEIRATNLSVGLDLVIVFSKFMGHSQVAIARSFCQKHDISFIDNYQNHSLGSLQMAAEHAKTHGPQWFSDAYATFHAGRKKRPNPWNARRHRSRRVGSYGN